jgi:FkbM family methyltransferase
MFGPLKRLYPVRELARILDLHFAKIESLFVRIDDLDRLSRRTEDLVYRTGQTIQQNQSEGQARLQAEIDHAMARLNGDLVASSAEGARDRASLLQGVTFALEQMRVLLDRLNGAEDAQRRLSGALGSIQDGLANLAAGQSKLAADASIARSELREVRNAVVAGQSKIETDNAVALSVLRESGEALAALQTQAVGAIVELTVGNGEHVRAGSSGLIRPGVGVRSTGFDFENPDVGLLAHLRDSLLRPVALDIGANLGQVSERLLARGYEVFAFEPYPETFAQLTQRFKQHQKFHAFELAIGPKDCEMDLHLAADLTTEKTWPRSNLFHSLVTHAMPEKLEFTRQVPVRVRSIESLVHAQEVPAEISLVKIDTEGFDLAVMQGMGDLAPDVVMAEFWDREMVFGGATGRLESMVEHMRGRGYSWHIVIYRLDGKPISYYCNCPSSVAGSWGNVVFFRDKPLFREALDWCRAVLPATYFV